MGSHQDQPAHALLSIWGLLRFQLQCWSSCHGISLPSKLTLQTENRTDPSWLEWFVAFIDTDIVLGSQTSPCSSHISPVHISFPQGFYTPAEILMLSVTLMLAKKGNFGIGRNRNAVLCTWLPELGIFSNLPIEAVLICFKGTQYLSLCMCQHKDCTLVTISDCWNTALLYTYYNG